jgi:hypothetical protein
VPTIAGSTSVNAGQGANKAEKVKQKGSDGNLDNISDFLLSVYKGAQLLEKAPPTTKQHNAPQRHQPAVSSR